MSFEGQKQGFASMKAKFVRGQSHIGLQVFLSKHMIDNPVISSSYEMFVPADAVKVASVTTVYETSVE